MSKKILIIISTIILFGFVIISVGSARNFNNKIQINKIELKSKESELIKLNTEYDNLLKDKNKVDKNNDEYINRIKELEKERDALRSDLQARQIEIQKESDKLASASLRAQGVSNASAKSNTGNIEQIIRQAAIKNGLDENYLLRIARCESSLNPNAVNKSYYDNGHPSGLFQHISGYWPSRANKYGYPGASVFNAEANANVTAAMIKEGKGYLWECK